MPSHPAALTHSAQSLSPSHPHPSRSPLLAVTAGLSSPASPLDPRASTPATQRRLMWSGTGAAERGFLPHLTISIGGHIHGTVLLHNHEAAVAEDPETLARELRQEEAQPWIHEATPWKGHQQHQLWSGLTPGHGHGHGGLPWKVSPALQLPDASCVQAYKEGRPPQEASLSSPLL